MINVIKPAVALSNQLRFKAKFILLASMFYFPLLACFLWIVQEQLSLIDQYDIEQVGQAKIKNVTKIEQMIRQSQRDKSQNSAVSAQIKKLTDSLKKSTEFKQAISSVKNISEEWQVAANSEGFTAFNDYAMVYDQTLALRENIAALSGLSRESNATSFYLAEASVQRLPALIEYIGRTRDLTALVIENESFESQTYTLLVALDQRLDELKIQLQKTSDQLARVASKEVKSYIVGYKALLSSLNDYQKTLRDKVIDPDDISLSLTEANKLGEQVYQNAIALLARSDKLLSDSLQKHQDLSVWSLWALAVVLLSVILVTSYLITGIYVSLWENVRAINNASARLGEGDFTDTLVVDSKDELGDIAISFDQMQQKILALLLRFNDNVVQLKTAACDIRQLTDNMEQSLATQQENTHNVAHAVKQMSESVSVIIENTEQARKITEQANENVVTGQAVVMETASAITDISNEVNVSATVINELAKHSTEIGQFVNVIREIADQTNLLALNAAIEAARAGEQGRGFAVVADEVRTLASRTQESTSEIQRIIEQLQSGADNSVEAMNRGVSKAEYGVEKTDQVSVTFSEVTGNVEKIVDATVQISSAVQQQSQMVDGIDENTRCIAEGVDQVMQSAKDAAGAGHNLTQLAENLSKDLQQFRLEK
ncbi:MAG: methyl-accepting chemotaxis protein [Alteromonadaceae bacterium]|nr:methyl-accepting chemotaxis protein [Alteromonadaceae bacterium]